VSRTGLKIARNLACTAHPTRRPTIFPAAVAASPVTVADAAGAAEVETRMPPRATTGRCTARHRDREDDEAHARFLLDDGDAARVG